MIRSIEIDGDWRPTRRVRVAVVPNGWMADMAVSLIGGRYDLMRGGERLGEMTVTRAWTSLPREHAPHPFLHVEGVYGE